MRPKHEIGQIIRDWGDDFFDSYSTVPQVLKSFSVMAMCRTRSLGGHVEACPECGETHVSYNSCRDRHCPKCQHKERETWIEMRREEIIPGTKYFHVVFTIPDCFHPLAMANQAMFYTCMFRTAWATLSKFFGKQGLQGGMTGILHTWGSNLFYHPHIHCIVTGGGVDRDGIWHPLKGCRGNGNFLFPVHALSKVFRAKMLAALTKELSGTGTLIPQDVRKAAMSKDWVVFSRPPAKGVNQVLEYIGRYAYRVAISNSRIRNVTAQGMVTYDWKDYRNSGKHKEMTMHAKEFLHLFSMHILPPAFVRIRHYGLLSPSNREKVRQVQIQLGGTPVPKERKKKPYMQICAEKGWNIGICPNCKCPMIIVEVIAPTRAPPVKSTNSPMAHL
jgi:hypothetical protein